MTIEGKSQWLLVLALIAGGTSLMERLISYADNPLSLSTAVPRQASAVGDPHNQVHHDSNSNNNCLSLTDHSLHESSLESVLQKMDQVFITMPAKAAGSSLKAFVRQCANRGTKDNFLNDGRMQYRNFLLDSLEVPQLVASHVYSEQPMLELMEHSTPQMLHIHMYRNERDRLLSGIKEVLNNKVKKGNKLPVVEHTPGKKMIITETTLIDQIILEQPLEIGISNGKSLSCNVFAQMEQQDPNIIFVHYKQANQLQELLAKKFCPNMQETNVQLNVDAAKTVETIIQLDKSNNTRVPLGEWLKKKKDVLEWSLNLHTRSDCQAKTRQLEHALAKCPDHITRPVHYKYQSSHLSL